MKAKYLIAGILVGAIISFLIARQIYRPNLPAAGQEMVSAESPRRPVVSSWEWADSLDAVKTAPDSHKIVFEDSTVRILQVALGANSTEPVHTHQWRSVMWFTQATPMVYYQYGLEKGKLVIKDSIQIPQMPGEVMNHGEVVEPEGPHAIKTSGNGTGLAYRVEFKKEFRP